MKFFIALFALAAVAFAEPEADPAVYYGGLYNYGASPYALGHHAYAPYSLGYRAFSPYYGNFYGGYYGNYATRHFGGYRLFKREAEADPAFFYNNLYNYGAVTPYAHAAYATPFAYNHFAYNTHALPYAYHHAIPAATHVTQVSQGGVSSTAAIHSGNRVLGGYANAGNYVANSAGVVHVAKREAEADPALFYSNFYNYGLSPYAHGTYAHGTYAHAAYTPYSFGYRAYNPYYNFAGYRNFGGYYY